MARITFGTDGWRGVIADDFTFHRVAVVCEAIGDYLRASDHGTHGVALGYDRRFASEEFAGLAATVLTRQGIRVHLATASVPTPAVSYAIKQAELGGGIIITASHNPARYNGIKFKPWFAGSAPLEATTSIEERANALLSTLDVAAIRRLGPDPALLTRDDFVPPYLAAVLGVVDSERIRAAQPRLLVDTLYGATHGVLDRALRQAGCEVEVLHGEWNPGFGGLNPEPIPENLRALRDAVPAARVHGAVASDGDGDRLGAMTEEGRYLSPHHIFALLLIHLVEDRGERGGVVKTVSTSTMIDQLAQRYGLPLYETPIGFKYISQLMLETDILIGGEESGGIGVRGHIPERDATLAALLLVEMMAVRQTTFSGLLALLQERVGDHVYDRTDLHLAQPVAPTELTALRAQLPATLAGVPIASISERDGLKLVFRDGSWLLMRASGTEPVLRIYAESDSSGKVHALLEAGEALVVASGMRRAA